MQKADALGGYPSNPAGPVRWRAGIPKRLKVRIHICGVRGSTPAPGAEFLRYGGRTSCLAIAHEVGAALLRPGRFRIRAAGHWVTGSVAAMLRWPTFLTTARPSLGRAPMAGVSIIRRH